MGNFGKKPDKKPKKAPRPEIAKKLAKEMNEIKNMAKEVVGDQAFDKKPPEAPKPKKKKVKEEPKKEIVKQGDKTDDSDSNGTTDREAKEFMRMRKTSRQTVTRTKDQRKFDFARAACIDKPSDVAAACFKRHWKSFKPTKSKSDFGVINKQRRAANDMCRKYQNDYVKLSDCWKKAVNTYQDHLLKNLLVQDADNQIQKSMLAQLMKIV